MLQLVGPERPMMIVMKSAERSFFSMGRGRTRTFNLEIKSLLLCQLS